MPRRERFLPTSPSDDLLITRPRPPRRWRPRPPMGGRPYDPRTPPCRPRATCRSVRPRWRDPSTFRARVVGDVSPPIRPLMVHHAPVRIAGSWVRIRDVDLYVVSLGAQKGIPLVVIHGGPDWDHSYLLRPINRLANARRIVLSAIRG